MSPCVTGSSPGANTGLPGSICNPMPSSINLCCSGVLIRSGAGSSKPGSVAPPPPPPPPLSTTGVAVSTAGVSTVGCVYSKDVGLPSPE